jgi:hypothetical protein
MKYRAFIQITNEQKKTKKKQYISIFNQEEILVENGIIYY